MSISYSKSSYILFFLLLLSLYATGCTKKIKEQQLLSDTYIVITEKETNNERWAKYLVYHLQKRTTEKKAVVLAYDYDLMSSSVDGKKIRIEVIEDLGYDYRIDHSEQNLKIQVASDHNALWIIYQLIDNIAEVDDRFDASDLPPSTINFNSTAKTFDFSYRDPYFSPNTDPDYSAILGTHNIDKEWGIWGHNLQKILAKETNEEVFALVENTRNKEQICFSSEALLQILKDYIIDNHGSGEKNPMYFMIMPNDNDFVCTCPKCQQAGNTTENATPAVTAFIGKLSEIFPKHMFYTTAYRTTRVLPQFELYVNSGVLFSTIDLDKGVILDKEKELNGFFASIKQWKEKTPNIYLWDYAANFDDYLTPLPILLNIREQLTLFKEQGINGLFLNASGYDYVPFDDVKSFVLAALMQDTDRDVETLVRKFFKRNYPVSHQLLADYYMEIEEDYFNKQTPYNMYGGMADNLQSYFNPDTFIPFYEALLKIEDQTEKTEREKVEKLKVALSYPYLQLIYFKALINQGEQIKKTDRDQIIALLDTLEKHKKYKDMVHYKEFGGNIDDYISNWRTLILAKPYRNLLQESDITLVSKNNEHSVKKKLLNDGIPGFDFDYHQGWFISHSDFLHLQFSAEQLKSARQINLRFLNMHKHRFYPPEKVELWIDGIMKEQILTPETATDKTTYTCSIPVRFDTSSTIELKLYKSTRNKSSLACDEIQIY